MIVLNVTYNGQSADLPGGIDEQLDDEDIRRIAVEAIRSGYVPGLHIPTLSERAFADFVVDRFDTREGGQRAYLRPKVPFGAGR